MPHCSTCGTSHDNEWCPPEAFRVIKCSCGNEDILPCDVLFMGLRGCYCGQCEKDTNWEVSTPTIADLKKHWPNYGT